MHKLRYVLDNTYLLTLFNLQGARAAVRQELQCNTLASLCQELFSFFLLGRSRAPAALLIYHPHPPFVNTFLHLFSSFFLTPNPVFFSFKTSYIMCLSSLALQQLNCFVRNTCFFSSLTLLYKHRFTKKFRRKFCEKNAKPLTEGVPYAD